MRVGSEMRENGGSGGGLKRIVQSDSEVGSLRNSERLRRALLNTRRRRNHNSSFFIFHFSFFIIHYSF